MRLVDMVVQSPRTMRVADGRGSHDLPIAGTIAAAVAECGLRYILDRAASRQCAQVMFEENGLLAHPAELDALPERPFWLECYSDGDETVLGAAATGKKVGFLVETDPGGLSGRISCVTEAENGEACLVAGTIDFDLRQTSCDPKGYRIRHQESREVNLLLDHARLRLTEVWADHAADTGVARSQFVKMQAERCWYALPIVVTFTALMNARNALDTRRSDLAKLNVSRAKIGKPALMEHIEVSVNLAPILAGRTASHSANGAERRSPRLHFVRGHTVHRGGGSFWRTSHFRGEGGGAPLKTVSVTAGRRPVSLPGLPSYAG